MSRRPIPEKPDQLPAELRDAIAKLSPPRAPRGLIARVAAERAGGLRAAIPDGDAAPPAPWVRRPVLAAAAAALVVGAVALQRWSPIVDDEETPAVMGACGMTPDMYSLFAPSAFFLAVACAQEPADQLIAPAPPAALEMRAPEEGTWTYDLVSQEGKAHSRSVYTIRAMESGAEGAWLAVSHSLDAEDRRTSADTLFLAADGVTPVRRIMRRTLDGRAIRHMTMTYGSGTVEVVQDYPGYPSHRTTRRVAFPTDLGPLMTPSHGPGWGFANIVRRLPLHDGWTGSVYVPGFVSGYVTESLRVIGDETVQVPAGIFDCWRVTVATVASRHHQWLTLWVSKDSGLLVKTVLGPEGARVQESVLVSFEASSS